MQKLADGHQVLMGVAKRLNLSRGLQHDSDYTTRLDVSLPISRRLRESASFKKPDSRSQTKLKTRCPPSMQTLSALDPARPQTRLQREVQKRTWGRCDSRGSAGGFARYLCCRSAQLCRQATGGLSPCCTAGARIGRPFGRC